MSIENLNLFAHASAAALPMLTRTGSIPRAVGFLTSPMPLLLSVAYQHASWRAHSHNAAQFLAKLSRYLLPESLAFGYTLSLVAPEIVGKETTLLADTVVLA